MQDYLTQVQVMEMLKISKATLYRWMQNGQLKAYKLGRKNFFKPEDIAKMIVPRAVWDLPEYEPAPDELAELLIRIESSDAALARGEQISTDQVRAILAGSKENMKKQLADRRTTA